MEDKLEALVHEYMHKMRKQARREKNAVSLKQHDNANDSFQEMKRKFVKDILEVVNNG